MYRITDLNGVFLRDDFTFDETTEIGLDVEPAQGLYLPKWDGEKWIEGMPQAEIDLLKSNATTEPSIEERVLSVETDVDEIVNIIATIEGVTV